MQSSRTSILIRFDETELKQLISDKEIVDYFEDGSKKREVFFRYDVQGRRVLKLVRDLQLGTEDEKRYAYDGSEIIAELDEGNNILTRYTHSGLRTDDVLAVEVTSAGVSRGLAQASGNYLYLKDSLGSIQAITDIYGNIVQRYVYSSFGKLLKVTDDMGNEITPFVKNAFTYTNREWDEEIGLYYYRARYYDPALGRFLTEDPHPGKLAIPSTFNTKYTYVANNPMNLIDPTGESWVSDVLIIATVTVAIVATSGMAAGAYATWGAALMSSASAVGATAIGSALAAGALSAFEGGDFMQNFGNNFKSIFTISAAALAGSAIFHASAGTFASAGANTWYQGGIRATEGGGLTLFAASSYGPGLAGHEAGHTVQYIIQAGALSAGNKYGGVGMSGRDLRYALHAGYLANGLVGIPQVGNDGALW